MFDKIDIEIYMHLKRKIIKNSISRIIWSKKTFKSKVARCLTRVSESPNDSSSVDQCGVGLVCGTESRPFWIWLVFNTLLLMQSSSYSGFSKNRIKKNGMYSLKSTPLFSKRELTPLWSKWFAVFADWLLNWTVYYMDFKSQNQRPA